MTEVNNESFVQRWLILPKLMYFWLGMSIYTANGSLGNYLSKVWGFSHSTIGFVNALQGVNFIGAIFWTGLADRTGKQKWILAGAVLMNTLCLLISNIPKLIKYNFPAQRYEIIYTMVALTCTWFFQSAMFPLLDSAMIGMLTKNPRFTKDQFGYQRLFLSPAHVIGTFVGSFAQAFGDKSTLFYQLGASISAAIFILLVLIAVPNIDSPIPKSFAHHGHHEKGKPLHLSQANALPLAPSPIVPAAPELDMSTKKKERSPVVQLLLNPGFMFFMLFVISAGLLANVMTIFQQLLVAGHHAKKKSGGGILGAAGMAALTRIPAAASEVVVFLTSKPLSKAVGVYWMLMFSQIAGIIRCFCYAFVKNDKLFYPIEVLKGLNSGLIVSAGVRIASDMAPTGCSTTAQGFFSGTYKGIAITITGVVCGTILLFTHLERLFLIIAIASSAFFVLFFLKFAFIDRTLGLPGLPRKEPAQVKQHDTPSTSSFGSTTSSDAEGVDKTAKV